ncbi:MAG: hypothetical protein J7604_13100 [Sporocytophaga sp.]|uniref:hypothetical protein n=1 Tax=Sporocytophaga sp. TaxID=2231183 RepID=UPI001B1326EF|nr:hypothetical protein [Sporocytophaga sp.]MBO9701142.1 hypothetical protein [Sporocytophaga sp.]
MKHSLILIGFLFVTVSAINAQAQSDNDFLSLIKSYEVDSLPFCTKYSEEAKSNIESYSFDINQSRERHPSDEAESIIRKFFFGGRKDVYVQNIWDSDTIEIVSIDNYLESNIVYVNNVVIKAQKYIGMVFGKEEEEGSEMYFCTFTKKGELISKISFGFYAHAGSYSIDDEGGRAPYYAEKIGCINKDYSIITDDGQGEILKYKILASGKIVEFK